MKKTAKDFLSRKHIFLVTSNKLDRTSWKKAFNELGVHPEMIHSYENYRDASKALEEIKPKILLVATELKDKRPDEFLELYRSMNLNRAEDLCYLVSDEEDPLGNNLCLDYQLDGLIQKPYTANDLNQKIKNALDTKAAFTGFEKAKYKAYENLALKNFEKVEAFLRVCEQKGSVDAPDVRIIEGLMKLEKGETSEGVATLLEVGEGNSLDYLLKKRLFENLVELKRFSEAFEQAQILIEKYYLSTDYLQSFIKTSILSENYDAILDFSRTANPDDLKERGVANFLAAGLVLSSNQLFSKDREKAIEANVSAIRFSFNKNNIIEQALGNLCDLKEFELVGELIEEMEEQEELENVVSVPRYRASALSGESPDKIFKNGVDLTSKGVRDFYVYEILLESAVKLGRKKEYLTELAEDAGKYHPGKQGYFNSLIRGSR